MCELPVKYDVNIVLVHKIPEKMGKHKRKSRKVADESMKGLSGRLGINNRHQTPIDGTE